MPIVALARIAGAEEPNGYGPLQGAVQTPQDFSDSLDAMTAGASAEQVLFESYEPERYAKSFQIDFYHRLFDAGWQAADAVYHLQLDDSADLTPDPSSPVLGTNALGDPFLLAVAVLEESDLSVLSADEQNLLAAVDISRVWSVEGTCSTEVGSVPVVGAILYALIGSDEYWRFIPILEPDSEFVTDLVALHANGAPQSQSSTQPSPPLQSHSICASTCQINYNSCIGVAGNNAAACATVAAAALALCMAGIAIGLAIPLFGPAAGGVYALRCVAAAVAAVTYCLIELARDRSNCRTERDGCLAICCLTFPQGCLQ